MQLTLIKGSNMKKRNLMAVIFLSIITLGIYDIYWLVKVKKELNAKTSVKTPSILILFAPIGAVFVGAIIAGIASSGASDPEAATSLYLGIIYAISFLVIVPVTFYWFLKFSKAVDQYTHGEVNTAVAFLLLYLLRFIGMAVIQDKFNDMLDAGTVSSAPVAVEPAQPVPDTAAQNDTAPEPTTPAPAPADPPAEQTPPTETPTSPSSDQK
jgi:pyruvate/2-oxoglutarate dehydrogenase complex dihydrolipoamide acyltransferase (E2) component